MTVADRAKARQGQRPSGAAATPVAYEADLHGWAVQQSDLLRKGRLDLIDAPSLADEIMDVAHDLEVQLRRDLSRVIQHLLKWDFQPERRSRSWSLSIREHRRRVERNLTRGPGLRGRLAETISEAYESGRDHALDETGLPEDMVPLTCPSSWDIMSRPIEGPEPS